MSVNKKEYDKPYSAGSRMYPAGLLTRHEFSGRHSFPTPWLAVTPRVKNKINALIMLPRYVGRGVEVVERVSEMLRPRAAPRAKSRSALPCFAPESTGHTSFSSFPSALGMFLPSVLTVCASQPVLGCSKHWFVVLPISHRHFEIPHHCVDVRFAPPAAAG